MKKIIAIVVMALGFATAANAQFGIIGGFTSSSTGINTKDAMANLKGVSLYHVGIAYRFELGSFFAIQPQLLYQVKGADLYQTIADKSYDQVSRSFSKTGFLELSAGLQLGVDLVAVRPYLLFEPFVGYAVVKGQESFADIHIEDVASVEKAVSSVKNGLEYGFGVGGGLMVLDHIQISVQWFMNLGNLYNGQQIDAAQIADNVKTYYKDIKNYQGIKVTLGIFF